MTETFAVTMFCPDDPEAKGASAGRARGPRLLPSFIRLPLRALRWLLAAHIPRRQ